MKQYKHHILLGIRMENHRVIANLLSREQFFTFESDLHSGLCDITLHVDEIVLDISKYIKQIILKTNTFDEKVDGDMLNVYHYITKKQVSYDYINNITRIPLHFGPIVDEIYKGRITFQVFTTGSFNLLSIHAKKISIDRFDTPFRKIHQCSDYMIPITCNQICKVSERFAFLIYIRGIQFNDVSNIIINIDDKNFCNCKTSPNLVWKEIKNGILIFADVDPVSSIYNYIEGDFTSYGDERINRSTIFIETKDKTKRDKLSIYYLSYLSPENMKKKRQLLME